MDDAVAIINAVADKNIDLMGITNVAGNVMLEHTTRNTMDVLYRIGGENVKIYQGERRKFMKMERVSE